MSDLLKEGRLGPVKDEVVAYISSAEYDKVLLDHVVRINQAHVVMMVEQGILEKGVGAELAKALTKLGSIKLTKDVEDVHMRVEEEVTKLVGSKVGGNLHIAKSRNDQVSTAIRMELRKRILDLMESILGLQREMLTLAEKHKDVLIPGYTHLRQAQPITFAHYLLSHIDGLERDVERLKDAYPRVNRSPMGSCALATTSFPIDRERVAWLLGFEGVLENSLDAVEDRDFILEVLADLTILSTHISRFAEDLIIFSSPEFGILEIPDLYSSTSSIMPQKKNPDVLEVVRARMASLLGQFVTVTGMVRTLPSGYNLDLQEVTPKLWEALGYVKDAIEILRGLTPLLEVKGGNLSDYSTATELANTLFRRCGVPFRTAYKIVASLVKELVKEGKPLSDTTPERLKEVAGRVANLSIDIGEEEIRSALDPRHFIESHRVRGGPAPQEVDRMLKERRGWMDMYRGWIAGKKGELRRAEEGLEEALRGLMKIKG